VDQLAGGALAGHDHLGPEQVRAGVERERALVLAVGVALGAAGLQDRQDVVGKIDLLWRIRRGSRGGGRRHGADEQNGAGTWERHGLFLVGPSGAVVARLSEAVVIRTASPRRTANAAWGVQRLVTTSSIIRPPPANTIPHPPIQACGDEAARSRYNLHV